IARSIRELVKPDGHTMIPFMNYQNMSEEDLTAIISYLRTTEPVKKVVQENTWNLMGKAVLTFFIKPKGPEGTPPNKVIPDTTIAYGKYLATATANCNGCHTPFSMKTGLPTGPEFSGGNEFESATLEEGVFMITPNLTPDPETGRISGWTKDEFVKRFHDGKLFPESAMPWGPYKNFSDNDLKAIYAYLMSLPAVKNETVAGVIRK
ncbi:MAG: c-type cytochrome, partial [Fimbriimonadaceae bacterium]|nr:c-type cytochrome [Chitinophagales bacterium]